MSETERSTPQDTGRAWWLWPVDLSLVIFAGSIVAALIGACAAPFNDVSIWNSALGNVFICAITGAIVWLYLGLPQLLVNLVVSIPAALALRTADPPDGRSTFVRLLPALLVWTVIGLGLFQFGYSQSAGIRYYSEPIGTGYQICHGLAALCWLLGPALFQVAVAVHIRHQQVSLAYRIARIHLGGLAIYSTATAVITGSIYREGPLNVLWIAIPSGYNIGYIEPHAILYYVSGIGLLFLGTCVVRQRSQQVRGNDVQERHGAE